MGRRTYGRGELIGGCLDVGIGKMIMGIGGSARNDGGGGMGEGVGGKFVDGEGDGVGGGGGGLDEVCEIDVRGVDEGLEEVELIVGCDVTNPVCGEDGGWRVFGGQKGVRGEMVEEVDGKVWDYG
ncbi:glycerate kinase, partial [Paenibacillus xylanexedens]|uniref:glycerate kinase n=1 Tax=Paenibacillus xylanexedens TaxID=528191 RepID=UPI0034D97A8B